MKRIIPPALLLTFAGVCCIITAYYCHFYYTLYQENRGDLQLHVDNQISELRQQLGDLAKQRHFSVIRAWGVISTTDLPGDESLGYLTNPPTLGFSKDGWMIEPELRLDSGSNYFHEYRITLWPTNTRVLDAWVSPPGDPEANSAFETFSILPDEGTNSLTLRVLASRKTSVRHKFTVVVLRDDMRAE